MVQNWGREIAVSVEGHVLIASGPFSSITTKVAPFVKPQTVGISVTFRRKFIPLYAYIKKKKERYQICNLSLHLKNLEKEQVQHKPKRH